MITHLAFIATPSIIAIHAFGPVFSQSISKSSLFWGQPLIMSVCNISSSAPAFIAFLLSSTDVHTRMFIAVLSVCMLIFIQAISWSLPSV